MTAAVVVYVRPRVEGCPSLPVTTAEAAIVRLTTRGSVISANSRVRVKKTMLIQVGVRVDVNTYVTVYKTVVGPTLTARASPVASGITAVRVPSACNTPTSISPRGVKFLTNPGLKDPLGMVQALL